MRINTYAETGIIKIGQTQNLPENFKKSSNKNKQEKMDFPDENTVRLVNERKRQND